MKDGVMAVTTNQQTNEPTNQQTNKPTNQQTNKPFANDDLLWRQLKTIPAFRAVLRAVESRFYYAVDLPGPTLDLGCGDGHFAQMTFDRPIEAGLDPWWGPLQKARRSAAYTLALQGMGDRMPFPDNTFASAFSNSVLEHIPDVQAVLNETGRVLQPNGRFLITMPSHYFTEWLGGAQLSEKVNLPGLAERYRRGFNAISRHVHTDPPEVWAARLAQAGLVVERWQYYFSPAALHALEIGHAQGLPAAIMHALTGHWILAPWESSLALTERWLRPFYEEEAPDQGAYLLFVARKVADGPLEAALPPARPFTVAELETAVARRRGEGETRRQGDGEMAAVVANVMPADPPPADPPPATRHPLPADPPPATRHSPPATRSFDVLTAGLLLLVVGLALVGQTAVANPLTNAWEGVRWFVYSFGALILLLWRVGAVAPSLPRPRLNLSAIPRRRLWLLAALPLVWLAYRQAGNGGGPWPPLLTIGLWLTGIAVAFYALYDPNPPETAVDPSPSVKRRLVWGGTAVLFLTALIIRAAGLTSHPFILNGLEAGIGQDVRAVADGLARNPFATGWLTNPTLPYYLLALPVKLLGPSVLTIRLLSPLVGALTVVAVFWLGWRLWRLEVGLAAAILLAGSHFHLHYSRLGLTNIWDGLLLLLAVGLVGLAWQAGKNGRSRRDLWLWAGLVVGLNAYFFTASRLLPLTLLFLLALALLADRGTLWRQGRHILAAGLLAVLVALPQMLYYGRNPGVFTDRWRSYGILAGQTGWLAQEAARTGQSELTILGQQAQLALLAFNAALDKSPAYGPGAPLLSAIPAILFVLGVMLALLRLRDFRTWLLLTPLMIVLLLGGTLLLETPSSHRLVVVAPLLSLLAAGALVEVGLWVSGLWPKRGPDEAGNGRLRRERLFLALLAIAMLLSLNEMFFYFGRYRQAYSFGDRNTEVAQVMADYLNSLDGATWQAYFYGPPSMYVSFPTIPFLATDFTINQNLFDVDQAATELPAASGQRLTFIYLPERVGEMELAQAAFGDGRIYSFPGHHADPLFYVYEVWEE
jgi:SAM-dependent methyltransferase